MQSALVAARSTVQGVGGKYICRPVHVIASGVKLLRARQCASLPQQLVRAVTDSCSLRGALNLV